MLTRVARSLLLVLTSVCGWLSGMTSRGEGWRKFEPFFPFVFFFPDANDDGRAGESGGGSLDLSFLLSFSFLMMIMMDEQGRAGSEAL